MKLYLIRHAESANNADYSGTGGELGRVPDPEITDTGHEQSRCVGEHLADPCGEPRQHPFLEDESPSFGLTHLYCSLMTRSILTAQYIGQACRLPLIVHTDIFEKGGIYDLDEDGEAIGMPGPDRAYFAERFPDLQLPDSMGDEGWYNRAAESDASFEARVQQALQSIQQAHGDSDDRVGMVVHGDFIDQFLNELVGVRRHAQNYAHHWEANWVVHNTSITRIDLQVGSQVIVYTNRLDHLPTRLITW